MTIQAISLRHSPLFDAARELLRPNGDESAAIWGLHQLWPECPLDMCRRMIRDAALTLHVAGERYDVA